MWRETPDPAIKSNPPTKAHNDQQQHPYPYVRAQLGRRVRAVQRAVARQYGPNGLERFGSTLMEIGGAITMIVFGTFFLAVIAFMGYAIVSA